MFEIKITFDKKALEVFEKLADKIAPAVSVTVPPVPMAAVSHVPTPQPAPMTATIAPQEAPQPVSQPVPEPPAPAPQPVATQAPTYTAQGLAIAATQLMDAGRQADVVALLGKYGVQALTMLMPEQYGAFATDLRTMGARI